MFSSRVTKLCLAALALVFCPVNLYAQSYPQRPLRLIVPFAPSGPTDILARALGQHLTEKWGQQIIIDNRPGAGGNIGTELAARAQADGYTLLMGTVATHGINPSLYKKLSFDAVKDFSPISPIAAVPNMLVVHPSVRAAPVGDLIKLARVQSVQLNYSSSGSGTASHLAAELFKSMAKIEMVHVPYKSAAPAISALLAGQVHASFSSVIPTIPLLKQGRLRALGVSTTTRLRLLPDIPTIAESGVPGYESMGWTGLLAPRRTPEDVITRINQDVVEIMRSERMRTMLENSGAVVVTSTPTEFTSFIQSEISKWANVVTISGAKLD